MSQRLDECCALVADGDGRYRREIDTQWFWGASTPHGGYLMALALHAMRLEIDDDSRIPRVLSQQFLGRVPEGELQILVTVERIGRATTSASARLVAGENLCGLASAIFTTDGEGPAFLDEPMPEVAPPTEPDRNMVGFMTIVHERFDFYRRFGDGGTALPCEDGGWVVTREPADWDHRLALVASDIWVPPNIRHPDRVVPTPSLHHVVHFGPSVVGLAESNLLVRHRLSSGGRGLTDEDIALWSDDGRLLLRARQLRSVVPLEKVWP